MELEASDFCLGPAKVVAGICRKNQWIEDIFLYVCLPAFEINTTQF